MITTSRLRREMLPAPANFYKQEFPRLSRPSRGNARCACPFHKGENRTAFSVNLDSGAFHCFNCGVSGGDLLAYVMMRDRLSFKEAAQSLGAWDESTMTWEDRRQLRRERERRQAERLAAAAKIEDERRQRIDVRNWLHCLQRVQDLASRRLCEINKGSVEEFAGETETCWAVLADYEDWAREADRDYCRLAGLEAA